MALEDHARLPVFIDQDYQVVMTTISMSTNSGQQRVDTLEGLAGFTPGSGDVSISGNYVIPVGGQQFPVQEATANGTYHTFQIGIGPKDYIGRGKFMDNEIGQSVNASTEGSLNWVGELKAIE